MFFTYDVRFSTLDENFQQYFFLQYFFLQIWHFKSMLRGIWSSLKIFPMIHYLLNFIVYNGHNLHFNECTFHDYIKSIFYMINVRPKMNPKNIKIPFDAAEYTFQHIIIIENRSIMKESLNFTSNQSRSNKFPLHWCLLFGLQAFQVLVLSSPL